MWWLIIPAIFIAFLGVLLIRTLAFKPKKQEKPEIEDIEFNREKAVKDLQDMVRLKTVSNVNEDLEDKKEFEKFKKLLKNSYPLVNKTCSLEYIGKSGIMYFWKGKTNNKPAVLMSHYDVVPVNEELWEKDAFGGIIENNVLWGRGTIDTKNTLCGVMNAVENLIEQGFTPERDIYLCFSGDEEISGPTAPVMVNWFKEKGIELSLVVDEGGAVVENVFPGVNGPIALIGIGEKGMAQIELSLDNQGGHASTPPPHTPVGVLAKAVCDVENNPFEFQLTKPVREMFDTLGRRSTFVYRLIFANLWCFKPVLNMICKKNGGEMNAMLRTTCAFTMMEGSSATNVIPPHAYVSANLRLLGNNTVEYAKEQITKKINNPDINVKVVMGQNPSIFSSTDCEGWQKIKNAVSSSWPQAIVSPYLMMACSDSRHYNEISDKVYRFSAMALTKEERASIHGNNERIPIETITKTVEFYIRLIKQL